MARYNPPTTSALGVIQARNAALEEANREANRAIGTQPFQAVRKLTRQVAELTELTQKLSDVIDAMEITETEVTNRTAAIPKAGGVLATHRITVPAGKRRAIIRADISGRVYWGMTNSATRVLYTTVEGRDQRSLVYGSDLDGGSGTHHWAQFSGIQTMVKAVKPGDVITTSFASDALSDASSQQVNLTFTTVVTFIR